MSGSVVGAAMLRTRTGVAIPLPVGRWMGEATPEEDSVLTRAVAPVLDIGCGPGRHVVALARRGLVVLGIDVSVPALGLARSRGAAVLERSVFAPVPGAGRWATALLLDGNIGIGGDPPALLRRIGRILRPDGRVLVELEAPGVASGAEPVRLEVGGVPGPWFPWARLGVDGVAAVAAAASFAVGEAWEAAGRWFALLQAWPA